MQITVIDLVYLPTTFAPRAPKAKAYALPSPTTHI